MKFHDTLNEKIWQIDNNNEIIPEVADKLKEIADAFIESLEIPLDAVTDCVITGSSASYNYTPYSDVDLHLKVDFNKVHEDCPVVKGYLNAIKAAFNSNHDIHIHGIPVEVYAEGINEDTVHNGLYSLWQGKWIDEPQKIPPIENDAAVNAKFKEIAEQIDQIEDSELAVELLNKVYEMRKAGLAEAGEFSTENLAFKKLRDEGYLQKLRDIKKAKVDKELSLEKRTESIEIDADVLKVLHNNTSDLDNVKAQIVENQIRTVQDKYIIDEYDLICDWIERNVAYNLPEEETIEALMKFSPALDRDQLAKYYHNAQYVENSQEQKDTLPYMNAILAGLHLPICTDYYEE